MAERNWGLVFVFSIWQATRPLFSCTALSTALPPSSLDVRAATAGR